eukprot:snap_masked-scaffold_59-processed-gene-0.85-mRNA-1 protein AED:1.00 eAED:1.00 QI:0/-1/0/0/-1/1/1/0/124
MNPNAVYAFAFNLTKQSNNDINRIKFWFKAVVKSVPRAPIIFIGTNLKLVLREKEKEELERTKFKVSKLLSEPYTDFQVPESEKVSFFPIENSNPFSKTLFEIHERLISFAKKDTFLANKIRLS